MSTKLLDNFRTKPVKPEASHKRGNFVYLLVDFLDDEQVAVAVKSINNAMVGRRWRLTLSSTDDRASQLVVLAKEITTTAEFTDFSPCEKETLKLHAMKMAGRYQTGWVVGHQTNWRQPEIFKTDPLLPRLAFERLPVVQRELEGDKYYEIARSTNDLALGSPSLIVDVFIINYGWLDRAAINAVNLTKAGANVTILSAECDKDVYSKYPNLNIVRFPSNYFYAHLWNEALIRSTSDITLVMTGDALIADVQVLLGRAQYFFDKYGDRAWVYAPDVNFTTWNYDRLKLPVVEDEIYEVATTDSTCWFLRREAMLAVGTVDTSINTYGYGIDCMAAYLAKSNNKLCVRDYALEVIHPPSKSYDNAEAVEQERDWVKSKNLETEYYTFKSNGGKLVNWRNFDVAMVTTCMGRLNHLKLTLTSNMRHIQDPSVEFVVLDYGGKDHVQEWLEAEFMGELRTGRLKFYRTAIPTKFHMAHAKNCVHRLARSQILVNMDADNFLMPEYLEAVKSTFKSTPESFVRLITPDKKFHYSPWGRVAFRRQDFIKIGGYEELLWGYGFEDSLTIEAATRHGLQECGLDYRLAIALEHPDQERTQNYDAKQMWNRHDENCRIGRELLQKYPRLNYGRPWGCLSMDPYRLQGS